MADRGYREAITYSFVDPVVQRQLFPDTPALVLVESDLGGSERDARVAVERPDRARAARICAGSSRVCGCSKSARSSTCTKEGLREIETLAGVAAGARWPEQWASAREALDFYDVKARCGGAAGAHRRSGADAVRRPTRCIVCVRDARREYSATRQPIGWLGELHPQLVKSLDLSNAVFLFELEIESAFSV